MYIIWRKVTIFVLIDCLLVLFVIVILTLFNYFVLYVLFLFSGNP